MTPNITEEESIERAKARLLEIARRISRLQRFRSSLMLAKLLGENRPRCRAR